MLDELISAVRQDKREAIGSKSDTVNSKLNPDLLALHNQNLVTIIG